MNQQTPDLASMIDESDLKQEFINIRSYINDKTGFNKQNCQQFLDLALINLQSKDSPPISKFMTILIFKEFTQRNEVKLFSLFTGHKLLKYFIQTAEKVDPRKQVDEKGAKLFSNQPETGRKFMRALLECLKVWGDKYGKAKGNEETKFYKYYKNLVDKGVTFPTFYKYVDDSKVKRLAGNSKKEKEKIETPQQQTKKSSPIRTQLNYTKDKILMFINILEDEEDPEQLQKEINQNHLFFQKQFLKYETKSAEIQNYQSEIQLFFNIHHFLSEEQTIYLSHIPQNKIQSYCKATKDLAKQIGLTAEKEEKFASNNQFSTERQMKLQTPPQQYHETSSKMISNPPPQAPIPVDHKLLLTNLYSRFEARSKSPHEGFKAVQKSLQKEKENVKQHPLKRTKSPNQITKSQAVLKTSALKESKISPIFSNPPNPSLLPRMYEGELILENKDLEKVLFNIKKEQGARRFKIANFREKSPLFENQHIQVGYKSQAVYENIHNFHNFIQLNLFIGNKTNDVIKDFQIEYKADKNQLLYASPRSVDSLISAGFQNKHDLMIIPLKLPFSFMVGNVSYIYQNTSVHTTIALPNSILKLASYMEIDRRQFHQQWQGLPKFKTQAFQICKHLPPDKINKWIPSLTPLTRYEDFVQPNSETDYQLCCQLILLQKFEALLKIIVRPNLKAVVQVAVIDDNQEAIECLKAYTQTLELILKETD